MKACCLHEMTVITMLSARWRKDEGTQRCDPRYKNKVSVNSCFNQIRRIGSVCLHVSQRWSSRTSSWTLSLSTKPSKSGYSAPGPESAARGSKSTTFAKGALQPFELRNSSLIQWGKLRFSRVNVRYTYKTELKLEKSSESEVGVLWVARLYRFWNLGFKHRGT